MQLLRFITAGSVDDGKSTLIGRLLYDSKSIFEDQLAEVERVSQRSGQNDLNLSLLTDGLRSEREQGITIDVAYRFFSTPKKKFIIVDAPGHVQYTRNMITGASNVDVALILIDATKGILDQTKRHSYISDLLRLKHIVVCVNKMDLVDYSENIFQKICAEYKEKIQFQTDIPVTFIPISALKGDNIVHASEKMRWHSEGPLLEFLEDLNFSEQPSQEKFYLPVQCVIRTNIGSSKEQRAYAGTLISGEVKVGDQITVLPSRVPSQIKQIFHNGLPIQKASAPMSVALELTDDVDISRGDLISGDQSLQTTRNVQAQIAWMVNQPLTVGSRWILRQTSREVRCVVTEIISRKDINSLSVDENATSLSVNDIGKISVRLNADLNYVPYDENKSLGSAILIDEVSNSTVAALMLL